MKLLSTPKILLMLALSFLTATTSAEPAPDGIFYIKAKHSGKCNHQHGHINDNGGNVTQWDCVNQPNVLWKFTPAPN